MHRFRKTALPLILLASTRLLAGCATQGKPPPVISLDEPVQAQPLPEPPNSIEVVTVPEPLALPAQLKPLPDVIPPGGTGACRREVRFSRQCRGAHCADPRGLRQCDGVWPLHRWRALYRVYASVGRVTVIALQPGEELVTVAGDTVRWIVGDTSSGSADLRVNVLVKPIRPG